MRIVPSPNGQTPPSARNRLVLPEPDGPVTSTRSPGSIENPIDLHDLPAVGQSDGKIVGGEIAGRRRSTTSTRGAVPSSPSAQPIEASNPASRFSTAFQSAMLVYAVTKNDSAPCTWPKAEAICINPPSVIEPKK